MRVQDCSGYDMFALWVLVGCEAPPPPKTKGYIRFTYETQHQNWLSKSRWAGLFYSLGEKRERESMEVDMQERRGGARDEMLVGTGRNDERGKEEGKGLVETLVE